MANHDKDAILTGINDRIQEVLESRADGIQLQHTEGNAAQDAWIASETIRLTAEIADFASEENISGPIEDAFRAHILEILNG